MGMKKKHVDLSMICYYLKSGKYPDGITDSDKRSIRKRSKDFRLKNGDMYFVSEGDSENGEDSSEIVGRKVLLQPDPIRKAFLECHVDDEGNHRSYDKTVKQFSDLYYLSQTIETVRSYIKDCPVCQAYRTGNNQLTPACKTPSERAEHVEELMAALPFTENVGEVITQFWQKVEVDLLGPYKTNGGNLVYVVICLDSYSLWPEAKIVEYVDDSLPMVEILLFILSLIARYGVMQSLMFRKDSFMHNDIKNQFDLLTDEENTLNIEFGRCQHTDEIWKDLESGIVKFTKKYVKDWSKCIELCLMPYRISRAELAEYTPAFLVHNREPRLPSSISYRQPNSDLDPNLSEAQMRDIQSTLMKISKILPEVYVTPNSPVKSSLLNDDSPPVLYYSPDEGETETPVVTRAKTKNAASNKLTYSKVDNKNSTPLTSATSSSKKNAPIIVTSSASMRSKKSVTNSVERSSGSQQDRGATSTPSPRKQTQQTETAEMEIDETDDEKGSVRKKREIRDVPLEEYYSALKLYLQHKQYPPGINDDYKRTIRKTAQNYVIEKDGLYYKSGTKLKKTVTDELERFKLLKQAHVLEDGTHLERYRTVARLKDYYWKGMTLDALALVKTCPVCEISNERRKSETNRCPAQESFLNLIKEAEAEPVQLSEAAQSRLYECLRLFLINGYKKKNYMSPEEIEYVEKESTNYKVSADGLLYHIMYEGIGGLRKVITTAAEKQKILTEIHILRTGIHRGVERTKSILHGSYYWVGINRDLKEFLEKCCLARVFPEKEKTPKSQEDKLAKFAEYFQMDLNQLNTQETNTPLNDRQPENILTSVGLKEKTPSAEQKNSSTAADNPGNQDAMEVALVEAAQAAEAHVAVPATEGDAAVSATEGGAAVSTTEGDATISVTGGDVAIPITEGDVAIPITEAQIAVLATEGDVATAATEAHVAIPAIEGDVAVPVTEADMTIPAIEGDVAIPVAETHVAVPATEGDLAVPVTEAHVAVPATEGDVTIPVTESDVVLSTSCLETADITDIATTISVTASTTTTGTDESTDPIVLTSLSDAITVTSTSSEIPTANVISESEAAALTDGQAVDSIENSEVDAADKVVKTYSEVACNTEDSDAIDDLDDSEEEEEGQIVTPKSISSNSTNTDSVSSTPLKLVRNVHHRLPVKQLNNQLKRVSNGNNVDEVESAVNNLKSEVDAIDIPDDFATLASMIQRRQTISAGESTEIPIPTEVFSPTISIKRGYEEMEDGELEEVEIIKGECVSLNSSLGETDTSSKGLRKIKGKQGKRKKQIACNVCGSMFGGQVALQIHMSTHSGVKPFSCEVCGKRFTERKYVRIHMRRHTGEKPYLCSICGKGFSRTQSLQSHILSHEKGAEDGLQKCGLCHRPFASESRLQAHMESKHPAVPKVYKCAECSRVFTAMRSLKRHIEAHMGLKRYECQHCGRRFLRKEYLRSHATQHTDQVMPAPKRKKPNMPCPQLKITVGSNTYSVFTSDSSAVPQEDQETWVAAELVQDEEQIQDPNETARATESVEQSVEAPLFFIAPNQVEYEVECTSSGGTELTEADLTAINILAQATLNTPTALPLT